MRIYTKSGDLAFSTSIFPDSQPHFKLETYEREFQEVTIEAAIKSFTDLGLVALAGRVLKSVGYTCVNLDCRYLLAARMDRAIDPFQPDTLGLVAAWINSCGFSRVRLLDVHSDAATRLIRNSENVLPKAIVKQIIDTIGSDYVVCPDKGAESRIEALCPQGWAVRCSKFRNPETGHLTEFKITDKIYHIQEMEEFLIVDDICDGGGTFIGIAKELRKAGAVKIYLYVTHGIFSKGLILDGIDHIYTTDSYTNKDLLSFPLKQHQAVTLIPVSMKDLR